MLQGVVHSYSPKYSDLLSIVILTSIENLLPACIYIASRAMTTGPLELNLEGRFSILLLHTSILDFAQKRT